jgi:hypothetical protein
MQVVSLQETSYVLVATLTLGLHSEPPYYISVSTIIIHRYLGRVRNRIAVWERRTNDWVISEFDVDFNNPPSEWFMDSTPKHQTQPCHGLSLADGTHCISTTLKGVYPKSLREYSIQTRENGTTPQAENLLEPSTAYNVPGLEYTYKESKWEEWTGTLVEFGYQGDIWVFRYGRP